MEDNSAVLAKELSMTEMKEILFSMGNDSPEPNKITIKIFKKRIHCLSNNTVYQRSFFPLRAWTKNLVAFIPKYLEIIKNWTDSGPIGFPRQFTKFTPKFRLTLKKIMVKLISEDKILHTANHSGETIYSIGFVKQE